MATTTTDDRITVGVPEACRISGLSRSYIYELMAAGRLRSTRVGSRRLIYADSLRDLLGVGDGQEAA